MKDLFHTGIISTQVYLLFVFSIGPLSMPNEAHKCMFIIQLEKASEKIAKDIMLTQKEDPWHASNLESWLMETVTRKK
jgi:hypothetical protein